MSAKGTKPHCSECGSADHLNRQNKNGVDVCPVRRRRMRAYERRLERERREAGVPEGACEICHRSPKAVRLVYAQGVVQWACRGCAETMRGLAALITGRRPEYEPLPKMRVVAGR